MNSRSPIWGKPKCRNKNITPPYITVITIGTTILVTMETLSSNNIDFFFLLLILVIFRVEMIFYKLRLFEEFIIAL